MTPTELEQLQKRAADALSLRLQKHPVKGNGKPAKRVLLICAGGACISCGQAPVWQALEKELVRNNLQDTVQLVQTGCMSACDMGPIVIVRPDNVLYQHVKPEDAAKIVQQHMLKDEPVKELMWRADPKSEPIASPDEIPFFSKQVKIVLETCGIVDPENIEDYVAMEGYQALSKALTSMTPQQVIDEVKASGIRGRGGAGFPTGTKWQMLRNAKSDEKYVICNADEGDPGAFMDRSVLEGDPHRVLEAMAIAGFAAGASKGFVYVRAEYPLAIRRLQIALEQARRYGLLGRRILGTDFSFGIEIRVGAGAFVCGEETALMASVQGKRGMPRPRPPFPTDAGINDKPTSINNVETFASIPTILRKGGKWYASIGTPKSTGTKVFALAGKVNNTGLVEVPMGTTLRTIIFEIGGGIPDGKAFKAAQTGGPSGGCIPAAHLDLPLDFDSLQQIGSIVGSGGLVVMDEDSCMVDVAKFFMDFCVDESCGKCPPCRVGTKQIYKTLHKICEGHGTQEDITKLDDLCDVLRSSSLCGLGQTSPNPTMSTLRHFKAEYEAHIKEHKCPAKVCKSLITYVIAQAACTGCSLCGRNCPTSAISRVDGQKKYTIDQAKCIHCGKCFEVCNFAAVTRE